MIKENVEETTLITSLVRLGDSKELRSGVTEDKGLAFWVVVVVEVVGEPANVGWEESVDVVIEENREETTLITSLARFGGCKELRLGVVEDEGLASWVVVVLVAVIGELADVVWEESVDVVLEENREETSPMTALAWLGDPEELRLEVTEDEELTFWVVVVLVAVV